MSNPKGGLPPDRAFLMSRTALSALEQAEKQLKLALQNIPSRDNPLQYDKVNKSLIKTRSALADQRERHKRESLRVAEQGSLV